MSGEARYIFDCPDWPTVGIVYPQLDGESVTLESCWQYLSMLESFDKLLTALEKYPDELQIYLVMAEDRYTQLYLDDNVRLNTPLGKKLRSNTPFTSLLQILF